jgi:hypothetical protein
MVLLFTQEKIVIKRSDGQLITSIMTLKYDSQLFHNITEKYTKL